MTAASSHDVALLAYAAALPTLRLPAEAYRRAWGQCAARGLRRKAVCAYDEDPITLAIAATRALAADERRLAALVVGSTTLPYEEKPAAATLVTALTDRRDLAVTEVRGSPLAGLQALALAADHCRAHPGRYALAVATDAPVAPLDSPVEHGLGAGAAAFLFGPGPGAVRLTDHRAVTRETFGGRTRRHGAATVHDPELRTDEVGPAIADLTRSAGDLPLGSTRLAIGGTAADARRVARALANPDAAVTQLFGEIGDAGAAGAPLALCRALDEAAVGETVLAVAVGGGATAVRLAVEDDVAAARRGVPVTDQAADGREIDYVSYLRHGGRLAGQPGSAA
jgi:hydroxymethylglutaryl-CoA synthase